MRDIQGLLARVFNVCMVVSGAAVASRIKFDRFAEPDYYMPFVAFSAAFSLALFPGFGVYESWSGRGKLKLARRLSPAWLAVQACALALMFSLHLLDDVSRRWFATGARSPQA
jgi:hypothetical protein